MKLKLPLLVGLASLASLVGVQAQSAVTDPVGYITIKVDAKPTGSTLTPISPSLVNKTEYAGVAATATATTITVTGTPFVASAYAGGNFYVEVTSGAGEGAWTNITANTTSALTIESNLTTFITAGTSTIKIRKHVTVADFFGATNTAGLKPGDDAGLADEVFFVNARTGKTTSVFYTGTGWSDADFADAGNFRIEPQQGLLVKRKLATPVSFIRTGYVKTGKTMLLVSKGTNVVGNPRAVGQTGVPASSFTLGTSGLKTASNTTGLNPGADAGVADEVFFYTNGAATSFFNDGTDWVDADFNNGNGKVIVEGTALLIKRKGANATAFNWVVPAVTIAP